MINWEDFEKIDIRTGTIVRVEPFEKARKPAYKLWVDFGEFGIKQSSAQITQNYRPESLVGKQIAAVLNFPPKQIADFTSECLILGAYAQNGSVILLETSFRGHDGLKIG